VIKKSYNLFAYCNKNILSFLAAFFGIPLVLSLKISSMSDNKNNIGSPDRDRINLTEDYEVRYWANKFRVSRDELKKVVRQVGDNPQAVEDYLKAGK